ncbi:MAG: GIY-YIG nuclease family protein [Chitinophagaceae bacterium]|nr:GIY-YIG nuclease family protein [Chitinophagaceae bacterium]
MFYVYILYSEKCDRYYVGFSADVHARLIRHNCGLVPQQRIVFLISYVLIKLLKPKLKPGKRNSG